MLAADLTDSVSDIMMKCLSAISDQVEDWCHGSQGLFPYLQQIINFIKRAIMRRVHPLQLWTLLPCPYEFEVLYHGRS